MNHLIIYAHPNQNSLNHFIKQTAVSALETAGHEVTVRDLYELNFNPVLSLEDMNGQRMGTVAEDVRTEQEFIEWADAVTFIYPIWWTGLPAVMKGYIDRVMSYGFAYRYDNGVQKGLLGGKSAFIINTHGKSNTEYHSIGMDNALRLTSDTGIYVYCGLEVKKHLFFDKADRAGETEIENWTSQIKEIYERV